MLQAIYYTHTKQKGNLNIIVSFPEHTQNKFTPNKGKGKTVCFGES
jgi:hypothetical protein